MNIAGVPTVGRSVPIPVQISRHYDSQHHARPTALLSGPVTRASCALLSHVTTPRGRHRAVATHCAMWALQRSSASLVRRATRLPYARARPDVRSFWKKGAGPGSPEADGGDEGEVSARAQ